MKDIYEQLGALFSAIQPRNERARTWLDRLILRCHTNAKTELNPVGHRASIKGMRFDFQLVRIIQGDDPAQEPLYLQIEDALTKLEGPPRDPGIMHTHPKTD